MKVDITSMPIGEKPPGFTEGLTGQGDPVRWQVLSDETAPGGRVIAETSRGYRRLPVSDLRLR